MLHKLKILSIFNVKQGVYVLNFTNWSFEYDNKT